MQKLTFPSLILPWSICHLKLTKNDLLSHSWNVTHDFRGGRRIPVSSTNRPSLNVTQMWWGGGGGGGGDGGEDENNIFCNLLSSTFLKHVSTMGEGSKGLEKIHNYMIYFMLTFECYSWFFFCGGEALEEDREDNLLFVILLGTLP